MAEPHEHEQTPGEQAILAEPGKKRRRRWFQFRLSTLLAITALAAGVAAAFRSYVEPHRRQRGTMALIEKLGGSFQATAADPWLRRCYGDDLQNVTWVDVADCDDPEAYLSQVARLPALQTLVVGGTRFNDEHLSRLASLTTLRWLVLDSTSVSPEAITRLRLALPNLDAYESERRAAETIAHYLHETDDQPLRTALSRRIEPTVTNALWGYPRRSITLSADEAGHQLGHVVGTKYVTETPEGYVFPPRTTDAALVAVGGLRRVLRIDLTDTQVTDAGVANLKHLRRLERLALRRTNIGDEALVHLAGCQQLMFLDLDCTNVTDAGVIHLKRLTQLHTLSLNSTRVSEQAVRELQKALPDCWVLQINY